MKIPSHMETVESTCRINCLVSTRHKISPNGSFEKTINQFFKFVDIFGSFYKGNTKILSIIEKSDASNKHSSYISNFLFLF